MFDFMLIFFPNKINFAKHGIDFETAMLVFNDLQRIEIYDMEHSKEEDRYNTIGMVNDVIFVVYMPYAGDDPETVKESQLAVIKDDEALQSLDAVKNGRVYPIMLSEMYASATRTQDGIETFAKGLYQDVNLD